MKFRSFIKKAGEKIFVQLGGNCLPESKKILSTENTFQLPLSSKDSPIELNLQAEIKRKFDSILRPNSELERNAFDNLAVEATEYSFLLMEKFDAYAQSY